MGWCSARATGANSVRFEAQRFILPADNGECVAGGRGMCCRDCSEQSFKHSTTCRSGKLDWVIALASPSPVFLPFPTSICLCFAPF